MSPSSQQFVDRYLRWSPWVTLSGFALVGCARCVTGGPGLITALMASIAGCSGVCFLDCKTPRSRCLLAALFLPAVVTLGVLFEHQALLEILRGQQVDPWWKLDVAVGTTVGWENCRFLIAMIRLNRTELIPNWFSAPSDR